MKGSSYVHRTWTWKTACTCATWAQFITVEGPLSPRQPSLRRSWDLASDKYWQSTRQASLENVSGKQNKFPGSAWPSLNIVSDEELLKPIWFYLRQRLLVRQSADENHTFMSITGDARSLQGIRKFRSSIRPAEDHEEAAF